MKKKTQRQFFFMHFGPTFVIIWENDNVIIVLRALG